MPDSDLPVIGFASQDEWETWLTEQHESSPGLWLKLVKKGAGVPGVTYAQALDVALCFGWIDGQVARFDDTHWLQRFTPRRARSKWSLINTDKAKALIEAGRMRPAGLREVNRAKADGRWAAAYAGQATIEVPPDLAEALAANPAALAFFGTITSQNRYAILFRVHDAKRPETRARRIATYVTMLADGKTIH